MKIVQIQTLPETEYKKETVRALTDDGRILETYNNHGEWMPWEEIPGPQAPEPATDYKAQRDELAGLLREVHRCEIMDPIPWDHQKSALIQRIEAALAKLKDTP